MSIERAAISLGLVLICACASVVEPDLAQPWSSEVADEPLTHARCVELAVASVPNAAGWRARLDKARAALEAAETFPNPTLVASFEDFGIPGRSALDPAQTTLTLGAALADIATRKRRSEVARHELAAEEARLLAERDRLAADVERIYDELVTARRRAALTRELEAIAEQARAAVARFVELGDTPRIDLERAEAERLDAGAQRARDELGAGMLEIELAFALGFERPVALTLSDDLSGPLEQEVDGLEDLLGRAVAANPDLAAAQAAYAAALERAHLAAGGLRFLPTVRAGPRFVGGETLAVAELETELPIFDHGQVARSESDADLLAAAAEVRAAAHRLAFQVTLASASLGGARKHLQEHAQPLAERRSAIRERMQRRFEAGEATFTDFVAARRDEVASRLGVLEAELALAHARVELALALGVLHAG